MELVLEIYLRFVELLGGKILEKTTNILMVGYLQKSELLVSFYVSAVT